MKEHVTITILIALLLGSGISQKAQAYWIMNMGGGTYVIECEDETVFTINNRTGEEAIDYANENCEGHGGVANIDPVGLQSAFEEPAGLTSGLTYAKDLGQGRFQVLTEEEFTDLPVNAQTGEMSVPSGYRLVSVKVNGAEVLLDAIPALPLTIPFNEFYHVDETTGNVVGGRVRTFRITSMVVSGPENRAAITWSSEAEESYRVESSTDLHEWHEIANIVAQGPETSFADDRSSDDGCFYRVLRITP